MEGEAASFGYFWAVVLGAVQGLAEFLPISSSGHLVLVGHMGMGAAAPAAFDVFLHLATLLVVILYFRAAILWYVKNDPVVLVYVVVASVPTGIVGLLCKRYFEALRASPIVVCLGLLVTACALLLAELRRGADGGIRDLDWLGAVAVGLCQTLALTPGISRSGMTIAGGMICGVERGEAFRFSFILSIPAVLGAVLLEGMHIVRDGGGALAGMGWGPLAAGFAVAVATGYGALLLLERLVKGGKLAWFALYCFVVAIAGMVYFNFIA